MSPKTTVRASLARAAAHGLAKLSPRLTASLHGVLMMKPPRRAADGLDTALRERARQFTVSSRGRAVAAWSWGEGPTVLLVHGWGGRGSQMCSFVEPLLDVGARVVAFDAPGHGASGGSLSSVVDMAAAILDVERVVGRVDAVVAHSAGGAATTLALHDGLGATRIVYVSPSLRPGSFLRRILRLLRLPADVARATRHRMERRVGATIREVDAAVATPVAGVQLLVVHDQRDRLVPHREGRLLSERWEGAELLTTRGLGHSRILKDTGVIECAVTFVVGPPDSAIAADTTVGSSATP
jgi:pimeloyl-ACP methyl ester carboxylesterase